MKQMIRLYTIPECPYCTELKDLLIKEGIEFTEVNVNLPENQDEYNRLHEITKSDDVPVVKVGKQLLVPNISFKSIKEGFELTKKFLG
jgi:glutaredoxin 3